MANSDTTVSVIVADDPARTVAELTSVFEHGITQDESTVQPVDHKCQDVLYSPATGGKGDKEAGKKPYRHVVASRWLVHHLLRYHYLPYWPSNVSNVFATVDIRTGQVVATCIFAYPVLRCHLREEVFGRLTADVLNRDFRQLVRLMVHPEHREAGIGRELLRWSMTKMPQPVIEAINRSWVPVTFFEDEGMIERHGQDRHYYYRLKSARSRVDETANPPAPEPIPAPADPAASGFPKIWIPEGEKTSLWQVVVQPYEGANYRVYVWTANTVVIANRKPEEVPLATSDRKLRAVTEPAERENIMRMVNTPLPPSMN